MTYPYLDDKDFLKEVNRIQVKEQYVRILILDWNENIIDSIEGRVTGGNFNIDGRSSIRRTCNLSMICKEEEIDLSILDFLSINKKVKIEVGISNSIDNKKYSQYKTLWFPQGVYIIINPNVTHDLNGVNISLQLRDKMCLLNGECGGIIQAATTFHEYDTIDTNGNEIVSKPIISQIIRELVHHFGGELLEKIIISDIPDQIKQPIKWMGSGPIFQSTAIEDGEPINIYTTRYPYQGARPIEYGTNIGFIYTDFTYPGELIANAGDSVVSVLDKIKNTLGNFEYFYDDNGFFIFQEIKNNLNNPSTALNIEAYANDYAYYTISNRNQVEDCLEGGEIVTAYSNTPQYNNIKNDFIVWGKKKSSGNISTPLFYHLSIDDKPKKGTFTYIIYKDPLDNLVKASVPVTGDVENAVEGFFYLTSDGQVKRLNNGVLESCTEGNEYIEVRINEEVTDDFRKILYLQGSKSRIDGTVPNYYYAELEANFPKIYDFKNNKYRIKDNSNLTFYLDIINSQSEVGKFKINNIGRRTKVINDDTINCLFEPDIPNISILNKDDPNYTQMKQDCNDKNQDWVQIDQAIYDTCDVGGSYNSAYELIRSSLNDYLDYSNAITITTLPIYYLQPNTLISIYDKESGISGVYQINTISLPLDINGLMTISATKSIEKI